MSRDERCSTDVVRSLKHQQRERGDNYSRHTPPRASSRRSVAEDMFTCVGADRTLMKRKTMINFSKGNSKEPEIHESQYKLVTTTTTTAQQRLRGDVTSPSSSLQWVSRCPAAATSTNRNDPHQCSSLCKDSMSLCRALGGYLTEITSAAENNFVRNLIGRNSAWMGINDILRNGRWVLTSSGRPLPYANWARGEPNNHGGSETCGQMFPNGRWNDHRMSHAIPSVCERTCTCPPSWTAWRSSCYVFISQRLQWLEAASLCMVFGGHLAEINSRDENIFVRNMISSHNVFFSWLGINDIARDGQWVLSSSGQPLTYWNWVAGEPNNAHGVTEACGGMYRDGRWNDDECVRSRTFTSVCERPCQGQIILTCEAEGRQQREEFSAHGVKEAKRLKSSPALDTLATTRQQSRDATISGTTSSSGRGRKSPWVEL
ncbi:hypothetical protein C0Q70_10482 [Pomacea canaliculata]|uniref:C-type lectin domain-containing protein n=1 Tax=Pomacea canaliculata TaxID=400727 RepID=A0A2T7P3A5_POMCA|nr:hypothetical protein C0Q70_10482 [Pomacea canaliculata]